MKILKFALVTPLVIGLAFTSSAALGTDQTDDGSVLPFPTPPMSGSVENTMQESVHKWRQAPSRLPENPPNIVIVMLDDSGFGQAETFGGENATPTLSRLADEGISYNKKVSKKVRTPITKKVRKKSGHPSLKMLLEKRVSLIIPRMAVSGRKPTPFEGNFREVYRSLTGRQDLVERDTGNIFLTQDAVCASDEAPSNQKLVAGTAFFGNVVIIGSGTR